MARDVLHIRLDSFFAVVEQKKRPNLHGKPVVVAEPKGNTSGVVISASKEAKRQGVKNGDSVRHAQRACPGIVIFKTDYISYKLVNEEFLDILSEFSPMLEPDELGSAYMDITADRNLRGDPSEICARIMREIAARLDMPLQIGCASNKLIAKIASGMGKGFVRVRPGNSEWSALRQGSAIRSGGRRIASLGSGCSIREADFLAPLPVSVLAAVTDKIDRRLGELGISNIGQLSKVSERAMVSQFGPVGSIIRKQALGIDFTPVKAAYPPEVIISEHSFCSPVEEPAEVEEALALITNRLVLKLRKRNVLAGEITLTIFDEQSKPEPAYFKFKKPTDSAYSINQALGKLLVSIMQPGMEVSKVQVSLSELTRGESAQLALIGDGERRSRLNRVTELLTQRFGEDAVFLAASLKQPTDAHLYGNS